MRSTTRLAAVLTAALVAAACTATEPPADDDGVPGVEVHDAPPPDPIHIDPAPVWTDSGHPLIENGFSVAFHDDTAVIVGEVPGGPRQRVLVQSLLDGQVHWQLDEDMTLPGAPGLFLIGDPVYSAAPVTGRGADWVVLVSYATDPYSGVAEGVAALSGQDGTVRWTAAVPEGAEDIRRLMVAEVTDNVVVVIRQREWHQWPTSSDAAHVVALGAADGTRRWRREKLAPAGIADGVLVGASDKGTVGLNLSTGRTRWELPKSEPYLVSGNLVLVDRENAELVDARTGKVVPGTNLGSGANLCRADDTMVACVLPTSPQPWLLTYRSTRRRVEAAKMTNSLAVVAVERGRIFVNTGGTYDSAAAPLSEDWPSYPVAISDRYVAFLTNGVSIHRLR